METLRLYIYALRDNALVYNLNALLFLFRYDACPRELQTLSSFFLWNKKNVYFVLLFVHDYRDDSDVILLLGEGTVMCLRWLSLSL